jgi:hypothetical protein
MPHLTRCTYALFISTKNNLRRKIILTKLFLEKNDFLEKCFSVFGSHEKITKCKNKSLANVAGIRQRPVAVARFQRETLTGSGRVRSYLAGSRPFWPDPDRSYPARSWPFLARSGKSRLDSSAGMIPTTRCCQTLPLVGFRRSTIANF